MFQTKKLVNKKILLAISFMLGLSVVIAPLSVYAKKTIADAEGMLQNTTRPTGISTEDLSSQAGNIIQWALRLTGLAFLILMVYGGFRWMTARGEAADVDKAKDTIVAAMIGFIIVVGAYALTNFLTQRFIQGQAGEGGGIGAGVQETPDAPIGCCEFKFNEIPTWTAFMMTQGACVESCKNALGDKNCGTDDYVWSEGVDAAQCDERRQDGLR